MFRVNAGNAPVSATCLHQNLAHKSSNTSGDTDTRPINCKPVPTTPFVPDNVNAILLSDYSYIYTMVSSLPDGIVIVLPDATASAPATMQVFLPALIVKL